MKDIMYAGFAQLSYLDWHKLSENMIKDVLQKNKILKNIFSKEIAFHQIITDSYINMYGGEKIEGDVIIKGAGYKISRPQRKDPIIKLEKDYVRLENKKKYIIQEMQGYFIFTVKTLINQIQHQCFLNLGTGNLYTDTIIIK